MALVPRVALLERLAAPESRPAIRDGSGATGSGASNSGSTGSNSSASESDAAVVRSVLFNLRRVLNSREGAAAAQMEFGLPSPQELLQNWPVSREGALAAIRRCLLRYEPRLTEVIVRTVPFAPGDLALSFQIAARLIGPTRTQINLTTAVTADGRVSLQ